VALPGAVTQSLAATLLGVGAAWGLGWGWSAGVVYGLALSVASTVVLTRVLADHNDLHTPAGHIAVGWLVVEDLFTVLTCRGGSGSNPPAKADVPARSGEGLVRPGAVRRRWRPPPARSTGAEPSI